MGAGEMTAYAEKLRDPRWQKKRLEVMQRDGFACVECGDRRSSLNVHHGCYVPGRDPWDYEDELLHTTCEPCHQRLQKALADVHLLLGTLNLDELKKAFAALKASRIGPTWQPRNPLTAPKSNSEVLAQTEAKIAEIAARPRPLSEFEEGQLRNLEQIATILRFEINSGARPHG
jgi:hypothetical protein